MQHPSIAPPFLDQSTLIDSNAGMGFPQSSFPELEKHASAWPSPAPGRGSGSSSDDLRRLRAGENEVCSFVVDDEIGWCTAVSPTAGLTIGYLWKTSDCKHTRTTPLALFESALLERMRDISPHWLVSR